MPRILRLVYRGFDTADRFPRALAVFCLHRHIAAALAAMPDSDPERPVALTNPRNIRRVLKRPNLAPR
jgi:hypothetical protein